MSTTVDKKLSDDLISYQLNMLTEKIEYINATQVKILTEISALKVKAGMWGLFGGLIPVIIGLGIAAIK